MNGNLQHQLERAKERLMRAAQACLQNLPGAAEQANAAQAEVTALLALIRGRHSTRRGPAGTPKGRIETLRTAAGEPSREESLRACKLIFTD